MIYRQYHDAGFRVFGLYGANEHGICLCDNPQCQAPYKHPITKNWQHTPEWDDDQLSAMEIAGNFDTGFGVLCNGYIVVDIDARNGGVDSYQQLNEDLGGALLSAGMIVRTGSGGGSSHLYFKAPVGVSLQTKLTKYPGIDFKSSGYVVGAGSMHASGKRYELLEGSPDDITDAPQALVDLLARPESHRTLINDRQIDVTDNDLSSMLAHISPDEARLLKSMGGAGTINPETGLPEYFSFKKLLGAALPIVGNAIAPGLDPVCPSFLPVALSIPLSFSK